ncbi:hypothetical protein AB0G02_18325 [Actinosynnema sp. NPDC023658]|uniref:hypothetical protein n=1 Tax=Actinosynnema sp. NPDC023658 TaxID=3155465 RepID=UPI0033CF5A22
MTFCKIVKSVALVAMVVAATLLPTVSAQATTGPGWNNLWVRAACVSRTPNPADYVEKFYVWVPNSPQGDKLFTPSGGGLGTYTEYLHYDNVYKQVSGNTYLNYRVHCRNTGSVRTGQIPWGGSSASTFWISIAA